MTKLYLICGFLGAGKTTYSQKLVKSKNTLHLNPDEWCMKLFSKEEYEQNWSDCFSKTIDFLWIKIKEAAKSNQDVILDMGFWTKESRDEARKQALELGLEPEVHYVYAPDEVLKERISHRTGVIAENNLRQFDSVKKSFEPPKPDEPHVLVNNF